MGLYRVTWGTTAPIMENQMEKKMENEMRTGIKLGLGVARAGG